jgi:hypothetical protein
MEHLLSLKERFSVSEQRLDYRFNLETKQRTLDLLR